MRWNGEYKSDIWHVFIFVYNLSSEPLFLLVACYLETLYRYFLQSQIDNESEHTGTQNLYIYKCLTSRLQYLLAEQIIFVRTKQMDN